ncbi:MAG: hypothetical protein K8F91_12055, partial [Candidatus Obscuribacterales bacterium]|nr:hypothetical protein [Candidatus Obscuribacterales bacterium]
MASQVENVKEADSTGQEPRKLSAMMKQYFDVKAQYPDALLFFRVGDFYEMFDTDAQVASRELDITLTGRPEPTYPAGRVPMAGVPYRAAEAYLSRLLAKGYCVAICEQVGVAGAEKGPIERQVTRILTPGTVLESHLLPARENNYLAAITCGTDGNWGLAYADASSGEFYVTELAEDELVLELSRIKPSEVLAPLKIGKKNAEDLVPSEFKVVPEALNRDGQFRIVGRPSMYFQLEPSRRRILDTFAVTTLEGFGCQFQPLAIGAAGAIIEYMEHTQGDQRPRFEGLSTYSMEGHLVLDGNTRKNLELVETSRDRTFEGSLLWTLDKTKTSMGGRMLRRWLMKPLCSVAAVKERQFAVKELVDEKEMRKALDLALSKFSDLERLSVRLSSSTICPKDLVFIGQSLEHLPEIKEVVSLAQSQYLSVMSSVPEELTDLWRLLAESLKEDAPREITEGGIFRSGYSQELDEVRELLGGGRDW